MTKQLTLKFTQNENTFENYYAGSNEVVAKLLQNMNQQNDIFCVYLWGNRGTGKSHLLKACIEEATKLSLKTSYFSAQDFDVNFAKKIEDYALIAIDNIEYICQKPELEETLFHLYNHLQANHKHLIISSIHPPNNLPIALPDLKSRLLASYSAMLNTLSDEEKKQILKTRSESRGFNLSEEVMSFIITHFPRDMSKLMSILDRIDEASLTEKRLVTVPFIKKFISEI